MKVHTSVSEWAWSSSKDRSEGGPSMDMDLTNGLAGPEFDAWVLSGTIWNYLLVN